MALFSPLILICVVLASLVYRFILHQRYLSPLSKIPNAHPTSSLSPLWIYLSRARHRENRNIYAAHKAYGPIVRLAPREVSINCFDGGLKTVYAGGFDKPAWYAFFENYGVRNMFSSLQSKPHSARKRMISNIYSKSYLQSSAALASISQKLLLDRILPLLDQACASSQSVEVYEIWNSVTMDFVTAYCFGMSNSTNFLQNEVVRKRWLSWYQSRHAYTFLGQDIGDITTALAKVGIKLIPDWVADANREIEAWCMGMCDAAETSIVESNCAKGKPPAPEDQPIVYGHLRVTMTKERSRSDTSSKDELSKQRLNIASEMLDHIAAGHDTSGITLTYLTWELSHHPALQSRLRRELQILAPSLKDAIAGQNAIPRDDSKTEAPSSLITSPKTLDAIPFLHAVLMETLRLHPAIPGAQPRVTPNARTTLAGYNDIPPGVTVSASAYSLHRNPDVFPEPERWRPDRWLEGGKDAEAARARWFWAFGSGGRMCVGSNFAMHELKSVAAAIYLNFMTSVVDDEGMEQSDAYTAPPKGKRLVLKFEKVSHVM
ncbi:MAG: hypothetical protein M1833_004490 [Piccolia ochrophora]|nr:MAG: hypothetical protein M1833_004490 [Piccolia ochrophora]